MIDALVVDHEHIQVLAHERALAVVESRERALGAVLVHVVDRALEQRLGLARRGAVGGMGAEAGEGRDGKRGQSGVPA